jgi:hypothetical protein
MFSIWEHAGPAAVADIENLSLVTLGLIFLLLAFLVQFFAASGSKIIARMRQELRKAQMMGKIGKSSQPDQSR